MHTRIVVQRLSTRTIFKLQALGLVFSIVPLAVMLGVLTVSGAVTLSWNDRPLTGWAGLIASPFIGLFIAALFTTFVGSATALGLWLYARFKPVTLVARSLQAADQPRS